MNKVILLVEDNENDEMLTVRSLKKAGIANEVVVVRDGEEAVHFIFGTGPHAQRDPRHTPAVTLDGQQVRLMANIELPGDTVAALDAGAVGVGLFRTEFLFMNRTGELPDEDEQFEYYRAAVHAMKGLPVTIRTIDVGADKPLDRMSLQERRHEHALNPALGLRAIRWSDCGAGGRPSDSTAVVSGSSTAAQERMATTSVRVSVFMLLILLGSRGGCR